MSLTRRVGSVRWLVQASLPGLHGHLRNALVDATWAMLLAGHCQLSRLALRGTSRATAPSRERRWQRLVANRRLTARGVLNRWASWVLKAPGPLTLIVDETAQGSHLRAMKLCRQVRGRAIPLLWHCYRPTALPRPQNRLVLDLLYRTALALPGARQPILLADRGLSWPAVLDFCTEYRWHYVLRVQGHTRVRLADGQQRRAADLAPRPGRRWCGAVHVFKKAGWRACTLVARWPRNAREPWLLITDLPPHALPSRQYRKRMCIEESFRDEKSHGFHWRQSRIRNPEHASRLLLIMALALALAIALGLQLIKTGHRRLLERPQRRTYSVFQLGLRYLQSHACAHGLPP